MVATESAIGRGTSRGMSDDEAMRRGELRTVCYHRARPRGPRQILPTRQQPPPNHSQLRRDNEPNVCRQDLDKREEVAVENAVEDGYRVRRCAMSEAEC